MTRPLAPDPHLTEMFRSMRRDARDTGSDTPSAVMAGINFVIDGGGAAITTGTKGGLIIPFPCRITKVELQEFDGTAGTITVDIKKAATGSAPSFTSITASATPAISSSGRYYSDSTLTGWTRVINRGEALLYNVTAAATIQRITVALTVRRLDLTG